MHLKKTRLQILAVLLLAGSLIDAIYVPEDDVTKPPKRREQLQWPPNHPNYAPVRPQPSNDNHLGSREEEFRGGRDSVLVHASGGSTPHCPEKATGQFTYLPDCRKFINCWKGRGFIQACAPGTLFNPKTLECDFPAKVKCLSENIEESADLNEEDGALEVPGPDYVKNDMIDVRIARDDEFTSSSEIDTPSFDLKHPSKSTDQLFNYSPLNQSPLLSPKQYTTILPMKSRVASSTHSPRQLTIQPTRSSVTAPSTVTYSPPVTRGQARFPARRPHSLTSSDSHLQKNNQFSPQRNHSPSTLTDPSVYIQTHKLHNEKSDQPTKNNRSSCGNQQQDLHTSTQSCVNGTSIRNSDSQSISNSQPLYPSRSGISQNIYSGSTTQPSRSQSHSTPIHSPWPTHTPTSKDSSGKHKTQCSMPGGSGVAPHPTDCGKFLNCWKGSAQTQSCAPGTMFNPILLQCDYPYNVVCSGNSREQELSPGKKWTPHQDFETAKNKPSLPLPASESSSKTTPRSYSNFYPPDITSTPSSRAVYQTTLKQSSSVYNWYPTYPPDQTTARSVRPLQRYNPPNGTNSHPYNVSQHHFGFGTNTSNPIQSGSTSVRPWLTPKQPTYHSSHTNLLWYSSTVTPPRSLTPPPTLRSRETGPPGPLSVGAPGPASSTQGPHTPGQTTPRSVATTPRHFTPRAPGPASSTQGPYTPGQTTPRSVATTPRHFTPRTKEEPLAHDTSDMRTYYDPGTGRWKTVPDEALWLPEPNLVLTKQPTLEPKVRSEDSAGLGTPRLSPLPPNSSSFTTTTRKPSHIMSIPVQGSTPIKQLTNSSRPSIGYSPSFMTSGQVLRLRGGPNQAEGYVEVQGSRPGWGLVCDKTNGWNIDEASVVCRQLGYVRGAELSWQGRPVRPTDDTIRVSVSEVSCAGSERALSLCRVTQGAGQCLIPRDAVGVRCHRNHASLCQPGEVNHGGKCYSVIVPNEDTAENAFSHGEALADCQKRKGKLLDITSQAESDFISELLMQSYPHINSVITSGVGVEVMGLPFWIWESSGEVFTFQKWWPGWTGNETAPTTDGGSKHMKCVVAKRVFPCQAPYLPDVLGLDNLCEANYFYWSTEDCSITHGHPYVCERTEDNIGCVTGSGANYTGSANVTASGEACLSWDSPLTPASLKYRMAYKVRLATMVGHNHCRNTVGGETHPWCYSGPDAQFQYCDIPICETPGKMDKCGADEFECRQTECILTTRVCDGVQDCSNGRDEEECRSENNFNGANSNCSMKEFACGSGGCIPLHWACDGVEDCNNGSDEQNCSGVQKAVSGGLQCGPKEFECRPGECILATWVCDKTKDCSNGRDEKDCDGP